MNGICIWNIAFQFVSLDNFHLIRYASRYFLSVCPHSMPTNNVRVTPNAKIQYVHAMLRHKDTHQHGPKRFNFFCYHILHTHWHWLILELSHSLSALRALKQSTLIFHFRSIDKMHKSSCNVLTTDDITAILYTNRHLRIKQSNKSQIISL